jgi:Amiloride-sensitive sodium channel
MTYQRTELYGRTDFLANCGSLLGLFLGVSVISLVEIVYYCCIHLCFCRGMNESFEYFTTHLSQRKRGVLEIVKVLVADYSKRTSIQGINYAANSKLTRTERLWWTTVVVISMLCCGWLISKIYWRNEHSPVTISLATEESTISQVSG